MVDDSDGGEGGDIGKIGSLVSLGVSCDKYISTFLVEEGSEVGSRGCNMVSRGSKVGLSERTLFDEYFYVGVEWSTCLGMKYELFSATILICRSRFICNMFSIYLTICA